MIEESFCQGLADFRKLGQVCKLLEEERLVAINMRNFSHCEQPIGSEMQSDCDQMCKRTCVDGYENDLIGFD